MPESKKIVKKKKYGRGREISQLKVVPTGQFCHNFKLKQYSKYQGLYPTEYKFTAIILKY